MMLSKLTAALKFLFFFLIIKPVVAVILGLNVRHRERLPLAGPFIIVANHNSHLDTIVLMSLFKYSLLNKIRPVAAADYFLKNRFLKWFSTQIMGIIPITRQGKFSKTSNPMAPIYESIEKNEIIIFFPEGTRGEPEQRLSFKKGISIIAKKYPQIPILPIFLYGLGKSLPKGEALLVPFFCDVFIGTPFKMESEDQELISLLEAKFQELSTEGHFQAWE